MDRPTRLLLVALLSLSLVQTTNLTVNGDDPRANRPASGMFRLAPTDNQDELNPPAEQTATRRTTSEATLPMKPELQLGKWYRPGLEREQTARQPTPAAVSPIYSNSTSLRAAPVPPSYSAIPLRIAPQEPSEPLRETAPQPPFRTQRPIRLQPQVAVTPPTIEPISRETQALQVVARNAHEITQRGIQLARRGAFFSARLKFIQAIREVANGLDAIEGGQSHSESLQRGLLALREADDFVPNENHPDALIDLATICESHRTPALIDVDMDSLTPWVALQKYYTFAQAEFTAACGQERAAGGALYALGKLHTANQKGFTDKEKMCPQKGMVYHQAALQVDPRHYMAANELGVLLAKFGQLQDARNVLRQSISVQPRPETWHNLSIVHRRLGETDLAQRAQFQWQLAMHQNRSMAPASQLAIHWVDPATFARTNPNPAAFYQSPGTNAQPQAAPIPVPMQPPSNTAWRPWSKSSR